MKGSPMARNFGIGKPMLKPNIKKPKGFRQDESDLKEWLIDEKGMTPADADKQIADGAHSTSDKDFLAWYKKNKDKGGEDKGGEAKGGEAKGGSADAMQAMMGMMGGGAAGGGETPMMLKGTIKNVGKAVAKGVEKTVKKVKSSFPLKGKQKNLDKNNNGRIDAEDFKLLKKKKSNKKKDEKKDSTMKAYGKKPAKKPAMEMSDGGKKDKPSLYQRKQKKK